MSCEKFEELLSLYAADELSREDRVKVDAHLGVCEACSESLAVYRRLETELLSRRELRPPAVRTAASVLERLGLGRERRPLTKWVGVPGLLSGTFIAVGIGLYFVRGAVADFFVRGSTNLSTAYSRVIAEWTLGLTRTAGGSEWALLAVYLGIFAVIMLTGTWMVLKFVRE